MLRSLFLARTGAQGETMSVREVMEALPCMGAWAC